MRPKSLAFTQLLLVLALWAGCQKGPRPVALDTDTCAFCRMAVSDPKFAGELVTDKGKVFTFDSLECLAAYVVTERESAQGTPWVTNYNAPGGWIKADEAFFVRSPVLRSPMALNVAAFKTRAEFEKAKGEYRGAEMRWADVLDLVRTSGFIGKAGDHAHGTLQP